MYIYIPLSLHHPHTGSFGIFRLDFQPHSDPSSLLSPLSPPFLILSLRVSHNARFSVRARNRNFRSIRSCVYMCVKKGARGRAKIVLRIRARRRIFRGRFTRTSIVVYSIASLVSPARLWKIIIKACTRDRTGG